MLAGVASERLDALSSDKKFVKNLELIRADLSDYLTGDHWYQSYAAETADAPRAIGYFSPEFGITEVLPQYSGGLGILAGDHLKAASDLGVPIIGVGLLYRMGYFRQSLNGAGWQQERYPLLDPASLPLTLLHDEEGPVRIEVPLAGRTLYAQIWLAQVGRVPLLLLDSDVEQNSGPERETTDRLYGGGSDHRLAQEVLLGIGGVRAIRAYCALTDTPAPEVFHTNEGHAGFLGLERIREWIAPGLSFDEALELNRAGTVFTTHTPVPAGIDRFPRHLIADQFGDFDALAAGADPGSRCRELPGRRPRHVQHGGDGLPARAAGQRGVAAARRGVPRDVPGPVEFLRHLRGAHQLDHQRRPPPDLGASGAPGAAGELQSAARP